MRHILGGVRRVTHDAAHASSLGWGEAGDARIGSCVALRLGEAGAARGVSDVTFGRGRAMREMREVSHVSLWVRVERVIHEVAHASPSWRGFMCHLGGWVRRVTHEAGHASLSGGVRRVMHEEVHASSCGWGEASDARDGSHVKWGDEAVDVRGGSRIPFGVERDG